MEIFHSYTRKQAIQDGILIDITAESKEFGFVYPIAITDGLFAELTSNKPEYEAYTARLNDALMLLYLKITHCKDESIVFYDMLITNAKGQKETLGLKCICDGDGDDDGEPVLTLMMSSES